MTATEELRRMLDERGVVWTSERVSNGVLFTFAKDGRAYSVFVRDRAGLEIWSQYLTPEQAIEATLGRRTCHMRETTLPFVSDDHDDGYYMICSECGFALYMRRIWTPPRYCSHCGCKVKED